MVDAYRSLYREIGNSPELLSHIAFESPGSNIESWFSKIGWILSLSERETFHLAAAEGMASGAVPVFLPRLGLDEIFTDRWIFDTPEAIADFIYSQVHTQHWVKESSRAQKYARRFDFMQHAQEWIEVFDVS